MKKVMPLILCFVAVCVVYVQQNNIPTASAATYQGDGYTVQYPAKLTLIPIETSSSSGSILIPKNYRGTGKDTPTWDVVRSGYKIVIVKQAVPTGWDWMWLAVRQDTNNFGKRTLEKVITTLGDAFGYKMVETGNISTGKKLSLTMRRHTLTTVTLHNPAKNEVVTMWMLTRKVNNKKYIPIFNRIVNSFKWEAPQ